VASSPTHSECRRLGFARRAPDAHFDAPGKRTLDMNTALGECDDKKYPVNSGREGMTWAIKKSSTNPI